MKYIKKFNENFIDFDKSTDFHKHNKIWFGASADISSVEKFIQHTKDNIDTFIELGAGDLSKSIKASENFKNVYSIELYPEYVKYCQDLIKEKNIKNINLIEGDILKDIHKLPQIKSAIYSFVPFTNNEKNIEMVKMYVNYFPKDSCFFFIGLEGIIINIKEKGELPELEMIGEVINYKLNKNSDIIYWRKK